MIINCLPYSCLYTRVWVPALQLKIKAEKYGDEAQDTLLHSRSAQITLTRTGHTARDRSVIWYAWNIINFHLNSKTNQQNLDVIQGQYCLYSDSQNLRTAEDFITNHQQTSDGPPELLVLANWELGLSDL